MSNLKQVGKNIEHIRHSLSHVLAMAVLERWPNTKLGVGPVIENGFYYDFDLLEPVKPEDLKDLETRMRKIIGRAHEFRGKKVSLTDARKLFKKLNQDYKLELLDDLEMYGTTEAHEHRQQIGTRKLANRKLANRKLAKVSLYQTGDFIDLCRGGHVRNTREINPDAFRLTKIAGAYWRGSEENPMLTRIYGVAFGSKKELEDYVKLQEELTKRDHRKLGQELELFSFEDISPGAPFWHPKGMIVYKTLERFWREIHDANEYQEISTPILVKEKLFEQSGHTKHYLENMFLVKSEDQHYYLKPMNCPESTIVYGSKVRSYRDLPLRFSEIGRLHRNELSGTLGGMLRVRQITMDDAHIFARPGQILEEISAVLKLVKMFYGIFKFKPNYKLATRPDDAMGDPQLWKQAEAGLAKALERNKLKYELKPKDGSFYGPKIDIHINDALGRDWQMATIQLDFQMPERFKLEYIDEKGAAQRPVMIHRAIFGSFERFFGILIEHYVGALPLWLSPVQAVIVPVGAGHTAYAKQIAKLLKQKGVRAEAWDSSETVSKKIRGAELQKIPYALIVGDKEKKAKGVRVRERKRGDIGMIKLSRFADRIEKEIAQKK